MTVKREPARLVEKGGSIADPQLLDALRAARALAPTEAQLQSLALKVGAATAAGAATAVGAGGMTKLQALWSKIGLAKIGIAVTLAGSAAYLGLRLGEGAATQRRAPDAPVASAPAPPSAPEVAPAPPPEPRARREATVRATSGAQRAASVPAAALPAVKRVEARTTATAEHEHGSAKVRTRAGRRASAADTMTATGGVSVTGTGVPSTAPANTAPASEAAVQVPEAPREAPPAARASELELLRRAQQLLARDPDGALEVIEEHAEAYPRGAFAQERDALAIDALRRLGRRAELKTRARAFLDRYPESPHADRIRGWLR